MIRFAGSTHPGLKRDHNEDCYDGDADLGLWLVADGVGGHANGEVASAITRDTIKQDLADDGDLSDAISHAHSAILEEIRSREGKSDMGSTVVALRMSEDAYEIAWVGDSRAYRFDADGELSQLTRDHSPVEEMLASGAITPEQAANHPKRHVLNQSLGIADKVNVSPDVIRGEVKAGDQFLLCSDGLTDELSDAVIAEQLARHTTLEEQVDGLINAALASGGRDNVTVLLVGAPSGSNSSGKNAPPSLEDTQSVGEAVLSQTSGKKKSHDLKVWIILLILVLVALLLVF